jgi:late competence protein required for DNA uptake (superfamily II DNA/RNA helicase)
VARLSLILVSELEKRRDRMTHRTKKAAAEERKPIRCERCNGTDLRLAHTKVGDCSLKEYWECRDCDYETKKRRAR